MESDSEVFCQACLNGDVTRVEKMLASNPILANARGLVHPDHREFMKKQNSEGGWTATHLAAHYGKKEVVQILIKAGADLNALSENEEANTPLMAAVVGGQTEIISLLLENGADPLKTDASGKYNAIKLAEADKKPEIYSLFQKFLKR
jgi:hypothetical protein